MTAKPCATSGELGLFCVELPEHYGGLGLDCVTAGLVLEALCRSDYDIGQLMVTMSLAGAILSRHGQPEIVERYLKGVVGGRIIPAIALTEPGGGSDAANLRLRARRDGDTYVLNGEKTSTSFATQAGFAVVWRGAPRAAAREGSAHSWSRSTQPASPPASSMTSVAVARGGVRCISITSSYPRHT